MRNKSPDVPENEARKQPKDKTKNKYSCERNKA